MSQLIEVFNEQLKAINQYNERRFVMMILDKTTDDAEKAFLADTPEHSGEAGKTAVCAPLDAPYRPGAAGRREDALAFDQEREEKAECLSGSGGTKVVNERPKHFDILDAMVHFNRTVFVVQKLCDDIVGVEEINAPTPDSSKRAEKGPCLLEVLERTPGNIHAACNMIKETVKEIRAQIL